MDDANITLYQSILSPQLFGDLSQDMKASVAEFNINVLIDESARRKIVKNTEEDWRGFFASAAKPTKGK